MLGASDEGSQTVCQCVLVYECGRVCLRCVPGGSRQQMFASVQIRADGPGGSLASVGAVV